MTTPPSGDKPKVQPTIMLRLLSPEEPTPPRGNWFRVDTPGTYAYELGIEPVDTPQAPNRETRAHDEDSLEDKLEDWFYSYASEEADGSKTLVLHEVYDWEAGPKAELLALIEREKAQARNHPTDNFVRGMHFGMAKLTKAELPVSCDPDPHSPNHNMVGTGDPCWCGSDNCTVCTICGLENHD